MAPGIRQIDVAKYEALASWLSGVAASRVSSTFAELDRLVGGLPPGARSDRTWWGNTTNRTRVQAQAWLGAGWQVDHVDLLREQVVFVRVGVSPQG